MSASFFEAIPGPQQPVNGSPSYISTLTFPSSITGSPSQKPASRMTYLHLSPTGPYSNLSLTFKEHELIYGSAELLPIDDKG
jgi:hypothetical protein